MHFPCVSGVHINRHTANTCPVQDAAMPGVVTKVLTNMGKAAEAL